jgi:hypothetical protein
MYQAIQTARTTPVITPAQLCAFARIDVPQSSPVSQDYLLLQTFIAAATDQIETMAAQACLNEQIIETYDFFPNQQDPRNFLNYQLSYAYNITPWWWFGFPQMDSIELVRRPVIVQMGSPATSAVTVTYYDQNGNIQTLDPSTYFVQYDKIVLKVGSTWPLTDRRQDCIQVSYWAGYSATDPTQVPARLQLAIMFLANHFWENRSIIAVEETSEVGMTLCKMLSSYRSMRIPR